MSLKDSVRNLELFGFCVTLGDISPIGNVPDGRYEVCFHVLVLQVVRVLPRVDDEQWNRTVSDIALVIINLLDDESLSQWFPSKRPPTGALHSCRGLRELCLELVETAEVLVDGGTQITI